MFPENCHLEALHRNDRPLLDFRLKIKERMTKKVEDVILQKIEIMDTWHIYLWINGTHVHNEPCKNIIFPKTKGIMKINNSVLTL